MTPENAARGVRRVGKAQMTPENALAEIQEDLSSAQDVSIVLSATVNGSEVIQRLNITGRVGRDFKRVAEGEVKRALNENVTLRPFEAGYRPGSHEMFYLDPRDDEDIAPVLQMVGAVDDAELFKESENMIDGLRFYAIVIGGGRHGSSFFRVYSPRKELTRSGRLALWARKGTYNRVKRKVFLFDEQVDCFVGRGYLFVGNLMNFQRIFEYFEALQAKASDAVRVVTARVPIENLKEFREACTRQPQMMAKIVEISRKSYLARLKMSHLRGVIKEFGLEIPIKRKNGEERLVFEKAPSQRWSILKLLDDDYLGSVMTEQRYEVNSKSVVKK